MKHNYTKKQLQAAIDGAMARKTGDAYYAARPDIAVKSWGMESPARLAILRAALDALPEPASQPEADPYARLKAYAKAGARMRCALIGFDDTKGWSNDFIWEWSEPLESYEVHPDDLGLCPEYAPAAQT